jgi:hypothetical protein
MPVTPTEIEAAESSIRNALLVRQHHRRRTERGDHQREADIALALERLREAMKPIRRARGQFPYEPHTEANLEHQEEIRDLSRCIQAQRRRLWKMQAHRKGGV